MKLLKHLSLFVALISLACSKSTDTPKKIIHVSPSDQDVVVGMIDSFSGTRAEFGNSARKGVLLAVENWNQRAQIHGRKVRIEVFDDEGSPEKSKVGFTKLLQEHQIVALIGASASSRSLALAPLAQENKVPMITPSSTHPDVTAEKDYVFRACFIDTFQGNMMGQFLRKKLSIKNIALLVDEDLAYSVNLSKVLKETFISLGGKVVAEEAYHGNTDIHFDQQLRAIARKKPDAIYIPGFYSNVSQVVSQARNLGIRTLLIGGDGWDSDKLFDQVGGLLDGAYFSSHFSPNQTGAVFLDFKNKFLAKHSKQPNAFAALGYDAALMMLEAMKRTSSLTSANIRNELAQTKNFEGVTGNTTLDASRNAIKPITILKIAKGNPTFVSNYNPN